MKKIVQTAGRNALNEFSPEFAHFNDDILFGENWNNEDIDLKTRSIITVVALMASGMINTSLVHHFENAKSSWSDSERNCSRDYPCGILCRLAKWMGGIQSCKRCLEYRRR